jgi:WD40 repeat protein
VETGDAGLATGLAHVYSAAKAAVIHLTRSVATASADGTARISDAATAKEIAVLRGHKDSVSSAAFSPARARVVTASADKTARIWDVGARIWDVTKAIAVLRGHEDGVRSAAFSPDGTRIVTTADDKRPPLAHPRDVRRPFEVVLVVRCRESACLAGGLAGRPAAWL